MNRSIPNWMPFEAIGWSNLCEHESVLLHETVSALQLKPGEIVLDGTLGSGGHAEALLEAIGPQGRLIGIDQDKEALRRSAERLERFKSQIILVQENYRNLDLVLSKIKVSQVDAVLLDIGVSKDQLIDPKRGFSFRLEGPLDMRMNQESGRSALDLVAALSEKELSWIFHTYGEERFARQIAHWIVEDRAKKPFETTRELAACIENRVPARVRYGRIHPATRIFQALRIAVNDELGALGEGIEKAVAGLKSGGRLAVITFHSLEDRIVKHAFLAKKREKQMEILTKKPIIPSDEEISRNPHSRSAKLRAAKKTEN